MATYSAKNKMNAKDKAKEMRKKGYNCNIYKKEKGYGISVTRKKK